MHFIKVFIFSLRAQMKDITVTIVTFINISFLFKRPARQTFLWGQMLATELISEHKLVTLKVE